MRQSKLAMTDPVSYNKYNTLQKRDNKRCLSENINRMTWRGGDRVLDIGSGDGSFTATELRRYLPDDVSELVGCDRSREMVDFANEHFGADGINFRLLEIGPQLPREFVGTFDHVFAFFSLHWITDQRLAFSQVYDILTKGGDCLMLIVGRGQAIFDVYKVFARSPKWCRWVKRLDEVMPPYHDCDDPEEKIGKIAEEVGFKHVYVQCNQSSYKYDCVEDFKGMIVAVNPFKIPEELCEEYLEEFVRVAMEQRYITNDLTMTYTTYTFFGHVDIGRFKWKIATKGEEEDKKELDASDVKSEQDAKCSGLETLQNGLGNHLWLDLGRIIRILDVGSGDGEFTSNELRRALPPNCEITGCDKSPAMVAHANTHHAGNRVKFELVEIGKPLPDHYIGSFDHIFSFFCYHWIPDHKVALSQTYDMLTDGGDCLLLIAANFPIVYDVHRWFSRSKGWSKWVHDLDPLTSPYHDCEDPETKLKKFAEEAGFKDIYVKNTKSTYTYASEQDIKNMMAPLNLFQIPEELMEEYLEEFVQVAKAEGYLSDTLTIHYSTNTIYARKY